MSVDCNHRKLEQLRRETAEATAKARQNAESSIKLMANTVSRKRAMEEAKAGLIIIQGWYGNLLKGEPETIKDAEFPLVIDVTIPLQFHVESSELHLQAGSKSNLLGITLNAIFIFSCIVLTEVHYRIL
jgi:DnaJ family protein C protein 11